MANRRMRDAHPSQHQGYDGMTRTRKILGVGGGLLAGIVVYYALMALLMFLVSDVLEISVSTADLRSLVIVVVVKLAPLIGAMLTMAWILEVSRRSAK